MCLFLRGCECTRAPRTLWLMTRRRVSLRFFFFHLNRTTVVCPRCRLIVLERVYVCAARIHGRTHHSSAASYGPHLVGRHLFRSIVAGYVFNFKTTDPNPRQKNAFFIPFRPSALYGASHQRTCSERIPRVSRLFTSPRRRRRGGARAQPNHKLRRNTKRRTGLMGRNCSAREHGYRGGHGAPRSLLPMLPMIIVRTKRDDV